jgi:hypothetical protein
VIEGRGGGERREGGARARTRRKTCPLLPNANIRTQSQQTRTDRLAVGLAVADHFGCRRSTLQDVKKKRVNEVDTWQVASPNSSAQATSTRRHPRVFSVRKRGWGGKKAADSPRGAHSHSASGAGGAKVMSVDIGVWFAITSRRFLS